MGEDNRLPFASTRIPVVGVRGLTPIHSGAGWERLSCLESRTEPTGPSPSEQAQSTDDE